MNIVNCASFIVALGCVFIMGASCEAGNKTLAYIMLIPFVAALFLALKDSH